MYFFQLYAALFGFESAVYSFGRWSAFLEAAGRRLCQVLWAMYVDDGLIVDLEEANGSGHALIHTLFELLGASLSLAKRTLMTKLNQFLGLAHDLRSVATLGVVKFWPREGLVAEMQKILNAVIHERFCTPATASKFRGLQGFCGTALFGKVCKAAIDPFRQRQYLDAPPWSTSHTMERSATYYQALFMDKPQRSIQLKAKHMPAVVIASDAQVEPGAYPGGGYLLVDLLDGNRRGAWYVFKDDCLELLGTSMEAIASGKQPIASCECAMLPFVLLREGEALRDRDIIWMVDNTAALGGAVKGTSGEQTLEKLIGLFWILTYRFQCRVWLEYVDSKSNWSDGISRDYGAAVFSSANRFSTCLMSVELSWLQLAYPELWRRSRDFERAGP